jgi:nitroimidazol reductase NimA-like FMN-containing flavoprotein (pyridoxamine 5'-phosphate oxidase superfamily)
MLELTDRTKLTRLSYRQVTDRTVLHAVLDAGIVAHVALTTDHGPVVLPVGFARDGERLLLHGSSGAGLLREAADGAQLAVGVTLLDGLVYARSLFDSSMNYRSVVVFGKASKLHGAEKLAALRLLSDKLMPGRWDEVRGPTSKELAATLVLAVALDEVSVKVRSGPPSDDEPVPDPDGVWAGELPLRLVAGEPVPAPDVPHGLRVPPSLRAATALVDRSAAFPASR